MGKYLKHSNCDKCGSSDGRAIYKDGSSWCFVCNNYLESDDKDLEEVTEKIAEERPVKVSNTRNITPLATKFYKLEDRGIDAKAAEKYSVRAVQGNEIPNVKHVYPYFDKDGYHIGNKCRTEFQKGFFVEGDLSKSALFGQQAFPKGGKSLTICEGECDALAAYQMFGHRYPAVSVKSSATAVKDILDNYEYVNSFEEIVLCFDNDKDHKKSDGTLYNPGQDAARQVAAVLPLGKVRIVTFQDFKDANDYLKHGKSEDFKKEWWAAPKWSPLGLKHASDMWEEVKKLPDYDSVPYPWKGLNDLTYGLRLSELVAITADPKVGKTSILREVVYDVIKSIREKDVDRRKIGLMFLEEPNRDTLLGLMSITANKPLHLPDIREKVSDDELKVYFDKVYKDEHVILWDHFGSNQVQKVLDYVRYMAALGCKYIVLDHLSIIVSDQSGDERKQLDEITTKLKQLTIELNICIICVVHQNRKGEIRGTAAVEQLSNIVIKLYRDVKNEDPNIRNTMKVSVEANRFCGRAGPACLLRYDPDTGRLNELSEEDLQAYLENNKKIKIDDEW